MLSKIYRINTVDIGTTFAADGAVPALTISANGDVNSGGWSTPTLSPWSCTVPPSDGLLDLDFLAAPPPAGVIVTQGFVPIRAHLVLPVPAWVRGVRVHAAQNSVESYLPQPLATAPTPAEGLPLPWPFPWFRPLADDPAAPQPFAVKLLFPDTITVNVMPPVPRKLSVRATATMTVINNSGHPVSLFAPTPCAIHDWELFDLGGRLVESEHDDACAQVLQTRVLEPGETIRTDHVVVLNGKLLSDGASYTLRFKFWHFEADATFAVRFAH